MKVNKCECFKGNCEPFQGIEVLVEYSPVEGKDNELRVKVWLRGTEDSVMVLISDTIEAITKEQAWKVVNFINTKFTQKDLLHHVIEYRQMKLLLTRKECFKCK